MVPKQEPRDLPEMWLGSSPAYLTRRGEPLFARKFFERSSTGAVRVYLENPPMVFSKLGPNDYLDTGDLVRFLGVSDRTLRRYIDGYGLRDVARLVGRQLFFRKGDVEKWLKRVGWSRRSQYLRRPREGR
ncbi:MAG: helix-turn-helix domain-containing protein [Candidatus Methylomirabilales bacterium]